MRSFYSKVLLLLLLTAPLNSLAQQVEIFGKVISKDTKEAVPFANIAIKDVYKGTASNALGEFSFKVDSLPLTIVITHLSFESREIVVQRSEELVIELTPGRLLMDEMIIQSTGDEKFAYDLVNKAYYKISAKMRGQNYGKAFYRQISKNGDEYSELYEIFYDTKYSNNGVDDWAIQEGRYALKLSTIDSFIYNKNFTQMVRLLTVVQPKTHDLIMPISQSVAEQFNLVTERILSVNNRKVALISFTKKEGIPYPALEGELSIDIDSYEVLKIKGEIADDNLNFISLTSKRGSWKNYVVSCEIAFKKLDEDHLALDYMQLQQHFDYYVDDIFVNKLETKSLFSYYEYYDPPKRKRLGGRLMRINQRDADALDAVGYNQLFWDENIIVKRTPIEAEVIESFERDRAFGSIYLNNTNQLILEDYQVDNDPFIIQVRNQLKKYTLPFDGEKVYVHLDKPMYMSGEDMWFKAYVVNMATNAPSTSGNTIHIHINSPEGKPLLQEIHHLEDGFSTGRIKIPASLKAGEYELIAFTDWMRNFNSQFYFSKKLVILNEDNETNLLARPLKDSVNTVELFPEGESLVQDMPAQIGFVAMNRFGETIDLKGRLLNNTGRQAANVKSEFHGFGSFFILPKKELDYHLMIMSDEFETGPFPEIKDRGYATMINNLRPNTIDITVRATPDLEGKKFYLLVISNGVLFDRRIGMITRGLYKAEIPKSNIPSGIAQILLVNEVGELQNRRLVFLNQPDAATLKYYLPKKEFRPGERIDMVLEVNDETGRAMGFSNISVSVVDRDKIFREPSKPNIRSYFTFDYLLDYDLDDSGSLFENFDRETLKKLDYTMLGQQTILPEINSFKSFSEDVKINLPRNKYLTITGNAVTNQDNRPLKNGYLTMVSSTGVKDGCWYVRTDDSGNFILPGINVKDSTKVIVMAKDDMGNPVSIDLKIELPGSSPKNEFAGTSMEELAPEMKKYLNEMKKSRNELRDVGITSGTAEDNEDLNAGIDPFGRPIQSISIDERYDQYANLDQLFKSRLPGTGKDNEQLHIRGLEGIPIYILDGKILNPLEELDNPTAESTLLNEILESIAIDDIETIEVIRDADITVFGKECKQGIIAIYSNKTNDSILSKTPEQSTEVWLPGYEPVTVFDSPVRSREERSNFIDHRTTLYWNPDIKTNRKGRAKISFYNSDEARNMQICVEGITQDGVPIFDLYDFGRNYSKSRRAR